MENKTFLIRLSFYNMGTKLFFNYHTYNCIILLLLTYTRTYITKLSHELESESFYFYLYSLKLLDSIVEIRFLVLCLRFCIKSSYIIISEYIYSILYYRVRIKNFTMLFTNKLVFQAISIYRCEYCHFFFSEFKSRVNFCEQ